MIGTCNSVNSICSGSLPNRAFRVHRVTVAGRAGTTSKTATMKENLIGRKFGRLTPKLFVGTVKTHISWLCVCDCGVERTVPASSLLRGSSRSCGCLRNEKSAERGFKHGLCKTRTYRKWIGMKNRCRPNAVGKSLENYVLRGIKVCDRWLHSFDNFLSDMGECPDGYEIERENNDGNYEPANCKWATRSDNQKNRRCSINFEHGGKTQTLKEWAGEYGLRYVTLIYRIKTGWPIEKALTTKGRK